MRTIKKKINKKLTKKKYNLKGGSGNLEKLLADFMKAKGIPSAYSKTKKTREKPRKKTKEEMRTEWIEIIQTEAGQNEGFVLDIKLIETLNKKTDQLGLLQYDGENSCFIDSAIFGLLITRSETINNSLLTGPLLPIVNKKDKSTFNLLCERCRNSDKGQAILLQDTARNSIRFRLKQIYTHIFSQGKIRKTLNQFNFRERFQSLELTKHFNFNNGMQGESAEVIMLLLELFPIEDKYKITVSKEKLYFLEENDLNLSIVKFKAKLEKDRVSSTENKEYKSNSLPVYNLKYDSNIHETHELTYDINPTTIANHSRNFISKKIPIYLRNLLFEKDISNESKTDMLLETDENGYATNYVNYDWKSEKTKITCNGDVLIVQLRRDSMVRAASIFIDTPVILDQCIKDSGENNLFLSTIIVKSGGAQGGHYKCYFRTGDNFYLFNDMESTIKNIGNYEKLMKITDEFSPTTRACVCIYKKIKIGDEIKPTIIGEKIIPPEINKYLSKKVPKGTLTKIKFLTPEEASKKYSLDKTLIINAREHLKKKTNWTCDELMQIFSLNISKESENRDEGLVSNSELMKLYGFNKLKLEELKLTAKDREMTLHELLQITTNN